MVTLVQFVLLSLDPTHTRQGTRCRTLMPTPLPPPLSSCFFLPMSSILHFWRRSSAGLYRINQPSWGENKTVRLVLFLFCFVLDVGWLVEWLKNVRQKRRSVFRNRSVSSWSLLYTHVNCYRCRATIAECVPFYLYPALCSLCLSSYLLGNLLAELASRHNKYNIPEDSCNLKLLECSMEDWYEMMMLTSTTYLQTSSSLHTNYSVPTHGSSFLPFRWFFGHRELSESTDLWSQNMGIDTC